MRELNEQLKIIEAQQKKEVEYQLKLKQSMEEAVRANIAKTDFLRRMSHDIRTPINGIRGMVEIGRYYKDDWKNRAIVVKKSGRLPAFCWIWSMMFWI